MADLTTSFMGLKLRNPIIVSSSNLTASTDKVVACEHAGAGAIVLKSLFEEQILVDTEKMMEDVDEGQYTAAYDYLQKSGSYHYLDKYFGFLEEVKNSVTVPIIASINCISSGTWIDYAQRMEKLGADGLELNIFLLPADVRVQGQNLEQVYLTICEKIRKKVKIPFSLKIGMHFSGLANIIRRLHDEGASGFVLFNRF